MARVASEANYLWLRRDLFYLLKARDKYADTHPTPAGDPSAQQQIQDQLTAPAVRTQVTYGSADVKSLRDVPN